MDKNEAFEYFLDKKKDKSYFIELINKNNEPLIFSWYIPEFQFYKEEDEVQPSLSEPKLISGR